MRVLSGIQPTGTIPLGQLLRRDPAVHRSARRSRRRLLLHRQPARPDHRPRPPDAGPVHARRGHRPAGAGLDPNRATLFVQSDVPEVCQLCWLLMTGTPMGLLERCHAYKDKKAKGLAADAGLVRLSGADGGRHPDLRFRHRAGGRGPGAAHRGLPRSGRQLQSPFRRNVRHAQGQAAWTRRPGCRASTARRCRRATATRWRFSRTPKSCGSRSCGS